jgi:hypothetical protein
MAGNGFERWAADLYSPEGVRTVLKFQNIAEAIAGKDDSLKITKIKLKKIQLKL